MQDRGDQGPLDPAARHDPALVYETWQHLYETVSEAIYILDPSGVIVDVNQAVVDMYGYAKHELVGQTPVMLAAPDRFDFESAFARLQRAFAGEPQRFVWWGRRKDGSEFPKELLLTRGRFFGRDVVVAMARDISRRVARQQALEASEARYRATFEVASDGLLIVDAAALTVRSANRRAGEILGRESAELVDARIDALLAPAGEGEPSKEARAQILAETLAQAGGEGQGLALESWCLRSEEGPLRWVDLGVTRFHEPSGEPGDGARLLISIHDITERKRSADALRSMEERERAADRLRALGELAAGVAHNFNNSLTSILAHAQVLARREGLPGEVRADLQVIERVAQGAAVTVRRIQSFARSRDPEAREFTDFGDVVGNAVALTRPRWQSPDGPGRWTLEYAHDEARPLPILGNAAELCEVIVNLILNGLDAMVDGGAMRVETGVEDDRVWVEVRDQGIGIDIDSQRRLFDPFFSTKGSRGLGLGLSVSHGIIRRHGGEISVVSEPGTGSAFTIWLPRVQAQHEDPDDEAAIMFAAQPSTILVVDDDAAVLRSLDAMLRELGHTVITARDGREALATLDRRRDIDLVLTDLAMPGLDGGGLLREVNRRWPSLPTALMTGLAVEADARAVKRANLLLRKPLELARVERALAQLLPLTG